MTGTVSDATDASSYRFVPLPRISAGRLVCRRVRRDDAGRLYESVLASMDHLRPWMPWAAGYTPEMAEDFVERNGEHARERAVTEASYVVCDASERLLGMCGLHGRIGQNGLEIGYWVDVRHVRRGIATLAAAALTELAMAIPELQLVEIHHDQANVASGAIPARLGYEHVATAQQPPSAPGEVGIEWQWRMTRDAWPLSTGARLLAEAP